MQLAQSFGKSVALGQHRLLNSGLIDIFNYYFMRVIERNRYYFTHGFASEFVCAFGDFTIVICGRTCTGIHDSF